MRLKHFLPVAITLIVSDALAQQPNRPRDGNLKVGDAAPDFTIKDLTGKSELTLSARKGKPVVLIFGSCT